MTTLEQFYALLKEAARTCPDTGEICTQLQAFRALAFESGREINTDNLGASVCDKDRPYFWSRKWENLNFSANSIPFDWPALVVYERNAVRKHPFGVPRIETWLEIGVIDALSDGIERGICSGCQGRTIHDIFRDTQNLLAHVLGYISNSALAEVTGINGNVWQGLYNLSILDFAQSQNQIHAYEVKHHFGASLGSVDTAEQFRVDFPAQNIYGTAVVVKITFLDCKPGCSVYELAGVTAPASCCS